VIPMICGLVKVDVDEGVGDFEEAMAEYVLIAGVLLVGDPDPEEVANEEVEEVLV
jgi:hypothetical protein